MAHLWLRDPLGWVVALLDGACFALVPGADPLLRRWPLPLPVLPSPDGVVDSSASGDPPAALLLRSLVEAESWLLVAAPGSALRVNGRPLSAATGARVLQDRDELAIAGSPPIFFSNERLARVETFPGPAPIPCARCRKPLEPGVSAAVSCPRCGVWHHEGICDREGKTRLCWSYGPECAGACDFLVADGDRFRFTPEETA